MSVQSHPNPSQSSTAPQLIPGKTSGTGGNGVSVNLDTSYAPADRASYDLVIASAKGAYNAFGYNDTSRTDRSLGIGGFGTVTIPKGANLDDVLSGINSFYNFPQPAPAPTPAPTPNPTPNPLASTPATQQAQATSIPILSDSKPAAAPSVAQLPGATQQLSAAKQGAANALSMISVQRDISGLTDDQASQITSKFYDMGFRTSALESQQAQISSMLDSFFNINKPAAPAPTPTPQQPQYSSISDFATKNPTDWNAKSQELQSKLIDINKASSSTALDYLTGKITADDLLKSSPNALIVPPSPPPPPTPKPDLSGQVKINIMGDYMSLIGMSDSQNGGLKGKITQAAATDFKNGSYDTIDNGKSISLNLGGGPGVGIVGKVTAPVGATNDDIQKALSGYFSEVSNPNVAKLYAADSYLASQASSMARSSGTSLSALSSDKLDFLAGYFANRGFEGTWANQNSGNADQIIKSVISPSKQDSAIYDLANIKPANVSGGAPVGNNYVVSRNPDFIQNYYKASPDLLSVDYAGNLVQYISDKTSTPAGGNVRDIDTVKNLYQKYPDTFSYFTNIGIISSDQANQVKSLSLTQTPTPKPEAIRGDTAFSGPASTPYASGSYALEQARAAEAVDLTPKAAPTQSQTNLADILGIPSTPSPDTSKLTAEQKQTYDSLGGVGSGTADAFLKAVIPQTSDEKAAAKQQELQNQATTKVYAEALSNLSAQSANNGPITTNVIDTSKVPDPLGLTTPATPQNTITQDSLNKEVNNLLNTKYANGISVSDKDSQAKATDTAYAGFKADQIVEAYNQGIKDTGVPSTSAYSLNDSDVKLLTTNTKQQQASGSITSEEGNKQVAAINTIAGLNDTAIAVGQEADKIAAQNKANKDAYDKQIADEIQNAKDLGYNAKVTEKTDANGNTQATIEYTPIAGATQYKKLEYDTLTNKKGDIIPIAQTDASGITKPIQDNTPISESYKAGDKGLGVEILGGLGSAGREFVEGIAGLAGIKEPFKATDEALVGKGTKIITQPTAYGKAMNDLTSQGLTLEGIGAGLQKAGIDLFEAAKTNPARFIGESITQVVAGEAGGEAINLAAKGIGVVAPKVIGLIKPAEDVAAGAAETAAKTGSSVAAKETPINVPNGVDTPSSFKDLFSRQGLSDLKDTIVDKLTPSKTEQPSASSGVGEISEGVSTPTSIKDVFSTQALTDLKDTITSKLSNPFSGSAKDTAATQAGKDTAASTGDTSSTSLEKGGNDSLTDIQPKDDTATNETFGSKIPKVDKTRPINEDRFTVENMDRELAKDFAANLYSDSNSPLSNAIPSLKDTLKSPTVKSEEEIAAENAARDNELQLPTKTKDVGVKNSLNEVRFTVENMDRELGKDYSSNTELKDVGNSGQSLEQVLKQPTVKSDEEIAAENAARNTDYEMPRINGLRGGKPIVPIGVVTPSSFLDQTQQSTDAKKKKKDETDTLIEIPPTTPTETGPSSEVNPVPPQNSEKADGTQAPLLSDRAKEILQDFKSTGYYDILRDDDKKIASTDPEGFLGNHPYVFRAYPDVFGKFQPPESNAPLQQPEQPKQPTVPEKAPLSQKALDILQGFKDTGYFDAITSKGTNEQTKEAIEANPEQWLAGHPYLYNAYSDVFGKYNPNPNPESQPVAPSQPETIIIEPPKPKENNNPATVAESPIITPPVVEEKTPPLSDKAQEILQDFKSTGYYDVLRDDDKKMASTDPEGFLANHPYVFNAYPDTFGKFKPAEQTTAQPEQPTAPEKAPLSQKALDILQGFKTTGYLDTVGKENIDRAEANPEDWLAGHPYLYNAYPDVFGKYNPNPKPESQPIISSEPITTIIEPPKPKEENKPPTVTESPVTTPLPIIEEEKTPPLSEKGKEILQDFKSVGYYDALRDDDKKQARTDPEGFLENHPYVFNAYPDTFSEFKPAEPVTQPVVQTPTQEKAPLSQKALDILQGFKDTGYLDTIGKENIEKAEANPEDWLSGHPYLYNAYSDKFGKYNPNPEPPQPVIPSTPITTIIEPPKPKQENTQSTVTETPIVTPPPAVEEEKAPPLSDKAKEILQDYKSVGYYDILRDDEKKQARTDPEGFLGNHPYVFRAYPDVFSKFKPEDNTTPQPPQPTTPEKPQLSQTALGILQGFKDTGYLDTIGKENKEKAEENPEDWLTGHPYLYNAYSDVFGKYNPNPKPEPQEPVAQSPPITTIIEPPKPKGVNNNPPTVTEPSVITPPPAVEEEKAPPLSDKAKEILQDYKSVGYYDILRDDEKKQARTDPEAFLENHPYVFNAYPDTFGKFKPAEPVTQPQIQPTTPEKAPLSQQALDILQGFKDSGYIDTVGKENKEKAEANPEDWLAGHPYLYRAYPDIFGKYNPNPSVTETKAETNQEPVTTIIEPPNKTPPPPPTVETPKVDETPKEEEETTPPLSDRASEILQDFKSTGYYDILRADDKKIARTDPEGFLGNHPYVYNTYPGVFDKFKPVDDTTQQQPQQPPEPEKAPLSQKSLDILQGFKNSGYIDIIGVKNKEEAESNPEGWLEGHPYLYDAYPETFSKFNPNGSNTSSKKDVSVIEIPSVTKSKSSTPTTDTNEEAFTAEETPTLIKPKSGIVPTQTAQSTLTEAATTDIIISSPKTGAKSLEEENSVKPFKELFTTQPQGPLPDTLSFDNLNANPDLKKKKKDITDTLVEITTTPITKTTDDNIQSMSSYYSDETFGYAKPRSRSKGSQSEDGTILINQTPPGSKGPNNGRNNIGPMIDLPSLGDFNLGGNVKGKPPSVNNVPKVGPSITDMAQNLGMNMTQKNNSKLSISQKPTNTTTTIDDQTFDTGLRFDNIPTGGQPDINIPRNKPPPGKKTGLDGGFRLPYPYGMGTYSSGSRGTGKTGTKTQAVINPLVRGFDLKRTETNSPTRPSIFRGVKNGKFNLGKLGNDPAFSMFGKSKKASKKKM